MGEIEAHMCLQSCAREDKRVFHTTSDSILRSRQVLVFTIEENFCSSWLLLLLAGCNEGAVVIGSTRTFAEGTLERTRQDATTEKDISRNTQSTFIGREFLMTIEREQVVQLFALEPLPCYLQIPSGRLTPDAETGSIDHRNVLQLLVGSLNGVVVHIIRSARCIFHLTEGLGTVGEFLVAIGEVEAVRGCIDKRESHLFRATFVLRVGDGIRRLTAIIALSLAKTKGSKHRQLVHRTEFQLYVTTMSILKKWHLTTLVGIAFVAELLPGTEEGTVVDERLVNLFTLTISAEADTLRIAVVDIVGTEIQPRQHRCIATD